MKGNQVYKRFWVAIPVIIILGFLLPASVDIFVYTDHYSLSPKRLSMIISIFLLLSGIGYFVNRKKEMNEKLNKNHYRYTAIGMGISMLVSIILYFKNIDRVEALPQSFFEGFSLDQFLAFTFMFGVLIVFLGFLIYIVNIAFTIFFSK